MIFIIGGHGLVGSAFARACEAAGRTYAILDRETYPTFAGSSCSLLINANGNSSKRRADLEPLAEFDASVRSVRQSLVDIRFERYIHLSSCDVYPDCSSPLTTREDTSLSPSQQSAYGFHKYLAEQCIRHAAKDWLIIRFGGFVGPGLKKNAIYDILNTGRLWLDPASQLQFLHTDDAAKIVLALVDRGLTRETINVCGKRTIGLDEVLYATGKNVAIEPGSKRVRYEVSIEKLSGLIDVPETRETVLRFVHEA